ncbi:cyclopropane-fatty-acyl-phospholipid synthase family protein [Algoriphagus sp.]|jgi:cyclopropane-fatty-acyl-phospholipid synthase|uniref:SAM-dependent methyltransferase n=1 Tax=Algoriphagus sp. TaxID=1872435 RepID=UPI00272398F9|nr:class I SAM-dependent methyltransferase [Algoriphagus sp.]MDO8965541.1 class I SAM-dependent methyltransferase [Algoriphagus sp.]MDP3201581.1 class I SAM-dependent methyltransferase [Algoriphagus sp.]
MEQSDINKELLAKPWSGSSVSEREGQAWDKKKEMDFTYTNIDKFIRYSLGENPVFSNAMYLGDFSISLEEAQRRKHEFVTKALDIKPGSRVLDLGCGWGGWLKYLKDVVGAEGIGVNLSDGQVHACRKNGLTAYIKDARFIKPEDFGTFDAITAFGSFEHVASVKDYLEGRQDEVYEDYFRHVYNLLKPGGKFYMQTMTFEKNMMPFDQIDINAPKDSDSYIMALLLKHNPDSWIPYGYEHVVRTASAYFKNTYYSDGRLDYVNTNREWTKRFYKFNLKKYLWFASLVPKLFTDKEFRHQLAILRVRPNRVCFEREIMGHARLVFEKL